MIYFDGWGIKTPEEDLSFSRTQTRETGNYGGKERKKNLSFSGDDRSTVTLVLAFTTYNEMY